QFVVIREIYARFIASCDGTIILSLSIRKIGLFFFFQAEDGIRDGHVTGVQTCALPILRRAAGTFAALGLELGARRVRWSGGPGRLVLLEGIDARVTVARSRIGRPGQALVVRQACA